MCIRDRSTTSILLRELTGYHGGTALPPTHVDQHSSSSTAPPTFPVPSPGMFNKNRVLTIVTSSFGLSLIHISEPTRLLSISYAVFCLKKKKKLKIIQRTYSVL
eukprot:TRINITY_DN26764_c0_g1_i2.p1 TRINITY_DN26764_c0_g1~~TRINITY_DN26764_c0_g1_i2.p1  ORF type:complete len:104 (+),score=33.38 TRINITY_DN26764_c0_g1_i2:198-509(+)